MLIPYRFQAWMLQLAVTGILKKDSSLMECCHPQIPWWASCDCIKSRKSLFSLSDIPFQKHKVSNNYVPLVSEITQTNFRSQTASQWFWEERRLVAEPVSAIILLPNAYHHPINTGENIDPCFILTKLKIGCKVIYIIESIVLTCNEDMILSNFPVL